MKDGWTSGGGLGLGLPGVKRLVNQFKIDSTPGVGNQTKIVTAASELVRNAVVYGGVPH